MVPRTRASIDELFMFEAKIAKGPPPAYTYEEAKAKLMQGKKKIIS